MALETNQRLVQCRNQACDRYLEARVATLPVVGVDLFVHTNPMCKCGFIALPIEQKRGL